MPRVRRGHLEADPVVGYLQLNAAVGHPTQRAAPLLRARDAGVVADEPAAEALGRRAAQALLAAGAAPYLAAAEQLGAGADPP